MALGFGAVRDALAALDISATDPTTLLNTAAKSFLNAVGASSGPLYATAFMRAAAAVKGKATLDAADGVAMMQAMAKGIADRGKAAIGEKTMIDAWVPAGDAAAAAREAGKGLAEALAAAAHAAAERRRGDQVDDRHQGPLGAPRRALARPYRSRRGFGRHRHRGDAQRADGLSSVEAGAGEGSGRTAAISRRQRRR